MTDSEWQVAMLTDRAAQIAEGVDPELLFVPKEAPMFRRRTEWVRDFGSNVAALERHAGQLDQDAQHRQREGYEATHGPVWANSDHRSVNR